MDFMSLVNIVLWVTIVVILPIGGVIALLSLKKDKAKYNQHFPSKPNGTGSGWRNTIFQILVRHPDPYKGLIYNRFNDLYWPGDEPDNRAGRRRQHKRRR
jgi:hypothetical protein